MNKFKYFLLTLCSAFYAAVVSAQAGGITSKAETDDFMRSDGKIWVVVAVIVIILSGLFLYLYNLDKKITSLEKNTRK